MKSLSGFDYKSMVDLISELPVWVMNPDYERVSIDRIGFNSE